MKVKCLMVFGLALLYVSLAAPKAHALIDLLWWMRR